VSLAIKRAQMYGAGGYSGRTVVQAGGLGSFLKKAVGGVARVATSLLPGPVGAVARVATNALLGTSASPAARVIQSSPAGNFPSAPSFSPRLGGGGRPAGQIENPLAAILPGGSTGRSAGCVSGYHPNKTAYFLRDGTFVDVGTRCVKNRRRNPLNSRALDRSFGRIASAGNAIRALGFRPPNVKKIATTGRKPSKRRKK